MTKRTGLSENARRLDAILDTAVDAIVTIEESGVIESIDPATERMLGYARAGLRVPTGQAAPPGSVRPVLPASRSPIRSRNGISIAQATATFTP